MLAARSLGPLLLSIAMAAGCTRENPAYDGGSGEGSGKGSLDDPGTSPTTAALDTAGPGSGDASDSVTTSDNDTTPVDGTTDTAGETGAMDCPLPAVDVPGYARCEACTGECIHLESGPPVVFNLLVCAPACEQSCQCPMPDTGSATPTCAAEGCVLDCSAGKACPDGMLCHGESQLCMWSDAYGPCDSSCPAGYCLSYDMLGDVCPAISCMDGKALDPLLCPPPPGGTATPVCFEPGNFPGFGWCVPSCAEGEMCPPGTMCTGGVCIHLF